MDAGPRGCTPAYCPPEAPTGREADLYALGKTVFEVATGRPPKEVDGLVHGFIELPGERTEALASVICRACAKDADERFSCAADMLAALREADAERADGGAGTPGARGAAVGLATDTATVELIIDPVHGTLAVPLPRGTHRVKLEFENTSARTAGRFVSLLSLLTVAAATALSGRQRPPGTTQRQG